MSSSTATSMRAWPRSRRSSPPSGCAASGKSASPISSTACGVGDSRSARRLKRPRQGAEIGDREFFGAGGRGDAGGGEQRLDRYSQTPEARAQHLAALAEGGGGDPFQRGL